MMTAGNTILKRREFLLASAAAATASQAYSQASAPDPEKMKRIAVMTLSLNSILKSDRNPTGPVAPLDFPEAVADHLGVHNVELDARTFFPSWDPAYIADFRKRLDKSHSQVSQIIMSLGTLTPTPAELQARYEGIDRAAALACPRVMVLTGGSLAPETRQAGMEALKAMAAYGKPKNVSITMENFNIYAKDGWGRGGRGAVGASGGAGAGGPAAGPLTYSPPWDVLLEVCAATGTYVNPDTGNFFDNTERMNGLPLMYPKSAGSSHVKFGPALYDTAECIKISKRVGYKGLYSIEAQGGGGRGGAAGSPAQPTDPYAACINIRDIILANM